MSPPVTIARSRPGRPLVVAHRGDRRRRPENTLAAFDAAAAAGADMVELDVTVSRDGHLVVIHDDTLERTTDGRGPVCTRTLAELRRLDAGNRFDPRFAGERIPTLEEVLRAASGRMAVNVEIKATTARGPVDPRIVDAVVALVRRLGAAGAVLVSSFDPALLARARRLAPEIARAVLVEPPADPPAALDRCRRLDAAALHPERSLVTADLVAASHADDRRVLPWTVDDPEEIRRLLGIGVDGVITDDPATARAVVAALDL